MLIYCFAVTRRFTLLRVENRCCDVFLLDADPAAKGTACVTRDKVWIECSLCLNNSQKVCLDVWPVQLERFKDPFISTDLVTVLACSCNNPNSIICNPNQFMWYIIYIYTCIYIYIYLITVSLFWMKHRPIGRRSRHAPRVSRAMHQILHKAVLIAKGQIVNLDALITSYIITIYHNIQRENLKDSSFWLFSPWKNHASHSIHRWSRCKVKWAIGLASASYIWGTALTLHSTEQSFSKVSITVFQNVSNILEFRWGYG